MRVLFLASYFPRPNQPLIGTWALEQARALARRGDLRVVCCVPYIPGIMGIIPKARPWIRVPSEYLWPSGENGAHDRRKRGLRVTYLKSAYYPLLTLRRMAHKNPRPQMRATWASIRRRMLRIVDEFKPEVIFSHHSAVSGYFASEIKRLRQIPFVVTDHDFGEIADCATLSARREFLNAIRSQADQAVCVAKRMETDSRRIFPTCRATTVHNGINPLPPSIFATPRPAERAGREVILSVGMFTQRKAFPLLIEAFKPISERYPYAVLRIVGDGKERPAIEAAISKHGLHDKVTLLGLQSPDAVFQEMAWADLFALPSWDEPFATVFVEAMGAGLPIIAAEDGGICDVAKHGVHGLLVPPQNTAAVTAALDKLLSNPGERRAMGARAKALVERDLMWDANAQRMFALFEQAVQDNERPESVEQESSLLAGEPS